MPPTHAVTWNGPLRQLAEVDALAEVVEWLWAKHMLTVPAEHGLQFPDCKNRNIYRIFSDFSATLTSIRWYR